VALLAAAGFRVFAVERCTRETAQLAERVHDRLRGVRLLGGDRITASALDIEQAIEMAETARAAIAQGALDYAIVTARRLVR
jgi:hypothetical protein